MVMDKQQTDIFWLKIDLFWHAYLPVPETSCLSTFDISRRFVDTWHVDPMYTNQLVLVGVNIFMNISWMHNGLSNEQTE